MKKYPKLLVVSHNCFSKGGSNGRTLANFLQGWPVNRIAQVYIYNEVPDENICTKYYRITDGDMLKNVFGIREYGGQIEVDTMEKKEKILSVADRVKKRKRTPVIYLMRNMIWKLGSYKLKRLKSWINEFDPDAILFQAGDAPFMFDFSRKVAENYEIPLFIYNSENYYFKEYNYLEKGFASELIYKILLKQLRKEIKKTINLAKYSIYNTEYLRELYELEFKKPSTVVMTGTEIEPVMCEKHDLRQFVYMGNLGLGRWKNLIEIGENLFKIDKSYYLDVYGSCNDSIRKKLENAYGIKYNGIVPYEKVKEIMKKSTLVVHVENFSEFYRRDSEFAFSTKIADSLACGTCLFMYAPMEIAATKYLIKKKAACVVTEKTQLKEKLEELINDSEERKRYVKNAIKTAKENHDKEKNRKKFQEILLENI